jgi:hypothetical protein
MDPTAFMYGGPYQSIGRLVVDLFNQAIRAMPARIYAGRPVQLPWDRLSLISYGVIDLAGLIAILLGGWLARRLQARQSRRNVRTTPLPLDAGAASPM